MPKETTYEYGTRTHEKYTYDHTKWNKFCTVVLVLSHCRHERKRNSAT